MILGGMDPLVGLRTLVWTQLPSSFFKYAGLAAAAGGLGAAVWISSTDPRGLARRMAIAYVGRLDTDLRSMFKPARGSQYAWLQICGALALLATYGFIRNNLVLVAAAL